jgi:hypothetical protein
MRGRTDRKIHGDTREQHPDDFYLGAWMGLHSPHMELQMLRETAHGCAECQMQLPILGSDVDTVKFGVYVFDDETNTTRHVCSNYVGMKKLCDAVEGVGDFDDCKFSLSMKDNYTKNNAILHFCNDGSDLRALRSLSLQTSIMWKNEELNSVVRGMINGLHTLIEEKAVVTAANGGPGFLNSECYGQCQGCLLNYPLLGMIYSSENHTMPLPLLT